MVSNPDSTSVPRTELWKTARCGGCARKVPALTAQRFARLAGQGDGQDLGSRYMADVAAVELGDGRVLGLTVDFITSVVPSPVHYGRIAAANALSDVYVAGMVPRFALSVACVPPGAGTEEFADALDAAAAVLTDAGCALVGGHSVVDPEAKLGFAVVGVPNATGRLLVSGARPDDALVLTKPLGVGILTSSCRAGLIDEAALGPAVEAMTATNAFLVDLVEGPLGGAVHAATDVTGFGLLGHLKEMCVRDRLGATLSPTSLPVLDRVWDLAAGGAHTSAFETNTQYVRDVCGEGLAALRPEERIVLTDPQTSGGALLAVAPEALDAVLAELPGPPGSAVVGRLTADSGRITFTG
ncbi:selenide, water dikinase SelD [Actinacidiphila reveromycinica]|nr:selenide, water dikinase SelD [Streptomyces sp. SN-593]